MSKGAVILLSLILVVLPVDAGMFHLPGGSSFSIKVSSITEQRFKTIYKQKYDFSCGSAALASLLSFHYDDVIDELGVFQNMFNHGSQEKIQLHGFSLLDMKRYLSRRGYRSDGFRISLEQLAAAKIPAITIINNKGYRHFVIIKGSNEKEVLVGDPMLGLQTIDKEKFEKMWEKQIIFVIQDKKDIASSYYQDNTEWNLRVKAQLGLAVDHSSLGLFNLLQPSGIDF